MPNQKITSLHMNKHCNDNPLLPHLPTNEQISILEVEAAVKKLRNGKSPGNDSITNNMIKAGGADMTYLLHVVYSAL